MRKFLKLAFLRKNSAFSHPFKTANAKIKAHLDAASKNPRIQTPRMIAIKPPETSCLSKPKKFFRAKDSRAKEFFTNPES